MVAVFILIVVFHLIFVFLLLTCIYEFTYCCCRPLMSINAMEPQCKVTFYCCASYSYYRLKESIYCNHFSRLWKFFWLSLLQTGTGLDKTLHISKNDSGVSHKNLWEIVPGVAPNGAKLCYFFGQEQEYKSAFHAAWISTIFETTDVNRRPGGDRYEKNQISTRSFAGPKNAFFGGLYRAYS